MESVSEELWREMVLTPRHQSTPTPWQNSTREFLQTESTVTLGAGEKATYRATLLRAPHTGVASRRTRAQRERERERERERLWAKPKLKKNELCHQTSRFVCAEPLAQVLAALLLATDGSQCARVSGSSGFSGFSFAPEDDAQPGDEEGVGTAAHADATPQSELEWSERGGGGALFEKLRVRTRKLSLSLSLDEEEESAPFPLRFGYAHPIGPLFLRDTHNILFFSREIRRVLCGPTRRDALWRARSVCLRALEERSRASEREATVDELASSASAAPALPSRQRVALLEIAVKVDELVRDALRQYGSAPFPFPEEYTSVFKGEKERAGEN